MPQDCVRCHADHEGCILVMRIKSPPVYTIGHSTLKVDAFVELLKVGAVDTVVDIRKIRRSRNNPQFDAEDLAAALSSWQIGYYQIDELAGRRSKSSMVPPDMNGFWINQSFHNYADYALSDLFRTGLSKLREISSERRCALMCSEAVWWRCHRRLVADYLIREGRELYHLMQPGRADLAVMNPAAREFGASLVYPRSEAPSAM